MDISREIEEMKLKLIAMANSKENPLKDAEIYEQSCAIDKKIVEFVKITGSELKKC